MSASGQIKITRHNPRICIYNNGTSICDKGHKISTPGLCVSQSIGVVNSTDDAFQPTYPVCEHDFIATLYSNNQVINKPLYFEGSSCIYRQVGAQADSFVYLKPLSVGNYDWIVVKSLVHTPYNTKVILWSNSVEDSSFIVSSSVYVQAVQRLLSLDSGWILRGEDITSQYFVYDIYSTVSILSPFMYVPKIEHFYNIISYAAIKNTHYEIVEPSKGEVSNPYLDEYGASYDNPTSICVGDLVSPIVEDISPAQYSHLNPLDSSIYFSVSDAIGGVQKSSVDITVSGNLTSQPEGTNIVIAGVPQTVQASFSGVPSSYSFSYNPTLDWEENEIITITVTGTDIVPISPQTGEEFSCYSGDPNPFGYGWTAQVLNEEPLGATITAIADVGAPYLENITPMPYFGQIIDDTDISFDIKDDLSGVDLDSLYIYINSIAVVSAGTPVGSNITITGDSGSYHFEYVNGGTLGYGSRVIVRVVVQDLYSISPNILDYTYYFDIVDDSTVVFEDFYPEVGITWNPESVNIEVDVIDRVYDIDTNDLFLSINGEECSSTVYPIYGNRNIITSVSGVVDVSNAHLPVSSLIFSSACVSNASVSGTSIVGDVIYGGNIGEGVGFSGDVYNFPNEYSSTAISSLINSYILDGTVSSGVVQDTLVSGVNWDGKYTDSTITDVGICSFYSNSITASGVVISGTIGRSLEYHPANDFDYSGAINVLVHGTNLNSISPVTRETVYQLFHGYNVKTFDREFNHNQRVNVYIEGYNTSEYTNKVTQGFYFETIEQPIRDLGCSITGIAPWEDITASIEPQAPVHKYGKTMLVEIYVEDEEGNELDYSFSYTIEEE